MKVLVVDDSKAMRLIVMRTLRQAGFSCEITEAADGKQALEAIRAARPDLVLSDWNMPEMTGIDFLRKLRGDGRTDRLGFVTSESSDDARASAKEAGALFLISKPFTPEAFRATLGPILG
jgi:two-component system chemotaxis response regulator CheY